MGDLSQWDFHEGIEKISDTLPQIFKAQLTQLSEIAETRGGETRSKWTLPFHIDRNRTRSYDINGEPTELATWIAQTWGILLPNTYTIGACRAYLGLKRKGAPTYHISFYEHIALSTFDDNGGQTNATSAEGWLRQAA